METLYIRRFWYGTKERRDSMTLGLMSVSPSRILYTGEDRWNANTASDSCIPDGVYRCVPTIFHRGGYATFEVTGVPGRSLIKIHKMNTAEDVQGCIGVGMGLGVLADRGRDGLDDQAILRSAEAFSIFMDEWGGLDEFELDIGPIDERIEGARLGG